MQAMAWLVACLAISLALHHRPLGLGLTALSLWCLLPGVASELLIGTSGGPLLMQPAASLAVIGVMSQMVTNSNSMMRAFSHRWEWTTLLACVSMAALMEGLVMGRGPGAISDAVDQIIGPIAIFFLLGSAIVDRPDRLEAVRWWFIVMASIQALFAVCQNVVGQTILFAQYYSKQYWFGDNFQRWMGTLDHPLILSLLLSIAMPLVAGVRQKWLLFLLPILYLSGLIVSQSRTGVAIGALGILYIALTSPLRRTVRVAYLIALPTTLLVAARSGALNDILQRFQDDSGSANARAIALRYFLDNMSHYLWIGGGLNSSFDVSEGLGLDTSFESAYLMYVIDLGLVTASVYFAVMVMAASRGFRASAPRGLSGAAAVALVVPQTFSALSGSTAGPAILWAVLAMCGFHLVSSPVQSALPLARHPLLLGPWDTSTSAPPIHLGESPSAQATEMHHSGPNDSLGAPWQV